uniref:Uncharacterized protein n=1 Tax=Ammonifex degensii TaxID=42838 RepID=A0A7C1FBH6_9THEO
MDRKINVHRRAILAIMLVAMLLATPVTGALGAEIPKNVIEMELEIRDGEKVIESKKFTAPLKESNDGSCLIYENKWQKVIIPTDKVKNKQEWLQNLEKGSTTPPVTALLTKYLSSSSSRLLSNPSGWITNNFYSYIDYNILLTSLTFTSGRSTSAWLGISPPTANSIKHTDTWQVSGLNVSYRGLGLSGNGGTASLTQTVNNAAVIVHNFAGLNFTGIGLYRAAETCTSTFQFSTTNFYTISCSASTLL